MGEAGLLHREKHLLRMHCRTEMLSWVSLTFAGVQADVNAVIEADFLLSFYRFLSRTWLTWGGKHIDISGLHCVKSKRGSLDLGLRI